MRLSGELFTYQFGVEDEAIKPPEKKIALKSHYERSTMTQDGAKLWRIIQRCNKYLEAI